MIHKIGTYYAKKGLELHIKAGVKMHLAHSQFYKGYTHFKSKDFDAALESMEKALQTSKLNSETEVEGRILIGLGEIMAQSGKFRNDDAIKNVQKGIDIVNDFEMRPVSAQGYLILGEIYLAEKNESNAIEHLNRTEKMFEDMRMDFWLEKTQKIRSLI